MGAGISWSTTTSSRPTSQRSTPPPSTRKPRPSRPPQPPNRAHPSLFPQMPRSSTNLLDTLGSYPAAFCLATAGRCRCSGGVHKATRSCSSGRDPGRGRPTVFGRRLRFAAGDRDPPPNTNAAQCHGVRVGCISQRSIKCWGFGARLTIEAGVHHSRLALGAQHSRAADRADSATMCLPLHALIIDHQNCPALHRHPGTTD